MLQTEQLDEEVWWKRWGLGTRLEVTRRNSDWKETDTNKERFLNLPFDVFSMMLSVCETVQHLSLDLFTPVNFHGPSEKEYSVEDLAPLTKLRGLRYLKLVGMQDSYQSVIWRVAWLCPYLEELTLEMALEPVIRRTMNDEWQTIKEGWQMGRLGMGTGYRGQNGQGTLAYQLGYSEYLDTLAIGRARTEAEKLGPVNQKLTIVKLSLTAFVVDTYPFNTWFDRQKLRKVHFGNDCVDAGFDLSTWNPPVEVSIPPKDIHYEEAFTGIPSGSVNTVIVRKTRSLSWATQT